MQRTRQPWSQQVNDPNEQDDRIWTGANERAVPAIVERLVIAVMDASLGKAAGEDCSL